MVWLSRYCGPASSSSATPCQDRRDIATIEPTRPVCRLRRSGAATGAIRPRPRDRSGHGLHCGHTGAAQPGGGRDRGCALRPGVGAVGQDRHTTATRRTSGLASAEISGYAERAGAERLPPWTLGSRLLCARRLCARRGAGLARGSGRADMSDVYASAPRVVRHWKVCALFRWYGRASGTGHSRSVLVSRRRSTLRPEACGRPADSRSRRDRLDRTPAEPAVSGLSVGRRPSHAPRPTAGFAVSSSGGEEGAERGHMWNPVAVLARLQDEVRHNERDVRVRARRCRPASAATARLHSTGRRQPLRGHRWPAVGNCPHRARRSRTDGCSPGCGRPVRQCRQG